MMRFLTKTAQTWALSERPGSDQDLVENAFLLVPEDVFTLSMQRLHGTSINVLFDEGEWHA